jgi:hypothetical protein
MIQIRTKLILVKETTFETVLKQNFLCFGFLFLCSAANNWYHKNAQTCCSQTGTPEKFADLRFAN